MADRLSNATSPYLQQHASNPVDWFEWGEEALSLAKKEDRPILLSIGYSACHWCHVMAHESFEDPRIAELMNERFVNIKVDREERPDIDHIYMTAVQAMTRHGGWPLTVFLTPDLEPFFGGTYFPPEPKHGLPSFEQILLAVHDQWVNRREDCVQHGSNLRGYLEQTTMLRAEPGELTPAVLDAAVSELIDRFDPEWGGFGGAPKFPQPMNLELLLRRTSAGDDRAQQPLRMTLTRMARGGIFDQLGGGFCRYSTDRMWLVPHFEKMLYDNAQLLTLYTRAWRFFGDELYRTTALMTARFMLDEMQLPDGGFASSLDADSLNDAGEPEEGAFYTFTYSDLIAAAGDDMPIAVAAFALAGPGNFEGRTVLWRPVEDDEVCSQIGCSQGELDAAVERLRRAWFELRSTRPRPGRDEKVLAGWNGMAIGALAEAGRLLEAPDLLAAAERAASFVLEHMRDADGRLTRSWREGRTTGAGMLEDLAMLASGLLTLYESTGEARWFAASKQLAAQMRTFFHDDRGGFHDTPSDAEKLLIRPKDLFDNALPSGNAVAADLLLRLSALEADPELEEAAERYLKMMAPALEHTPSGFGATLEALDRFLAPRQELAVVGDPGKARPLLEVADRAFRPNLVRAFGSPGPDQPKLLDRPEADEPVAFLCERFACQQPTAEPEELAELLARL